MAKESSLTFLTSVTVPWVAAVGRDPLSAQVQHLHCFPAYTGAKRFLNSISFPPTSVQRAFCPIYL